jgi:hypothetical protein
MCMLPMIAAMAVALLLALVAWPVWRAALRASWRNYPVAFAVMEQLHLRYGRLHKNNRDANQFALVVSHLVEQVFPAVPGGRLDAAQTALLVSGIRQALWTDLAEERRCLCLRRGIIRDPNLLAQRVETVRLVVTAANASRAGLSLHPSISLDSPMAIDFTHSTPAIVVGGTSAAALRTQGSRGASAVELVLTPAEPVAARTAPPKAKKRPVLSPHSDDLRPPVTPVDDFSSHSSTPPTHDDSPARLM